MSKDNHHIAINRSALVEQPLKTSAATGATLACMGLSNAIPLMHGSQGCGAFAKVYLIQHYREPIPLQNTAIDHIAAVMGGDDNLSKALALLCEKHQPQLIMVVTTGLTEMQGCDVARVIREFKANHPQYLKSRLVSVSSPDFSGSMQSGFAHAVEACVQQLIVEPTVDSKSTVAAQPQLNVFCSVALTSADCELIERYCSAFGFNAVLLPNLSDSLDGHLADEDFSNTSTGGTGVNQITSMVNSVASLVLGESLLPAAKLLQEHYAVPYHSLGLVMGLEKSDKLVMLLSRLSNQAVPDWINRQRKRLQDAMLDCHFLLSASQVSMALEPDAAAGYATLLAENGAVLNKLVTTLNVPELKAIKANNVVVGDLSDLTNVIADSEFVIGNTHCANLCEPSTPVLRAGFPCHDQFGNSDTLQVGYEGARDRLFAMANLLKANHQDEVPAHVSAYRFEPESCVKHPLPIS
ncbi:nitrogenase iron-molybdenum cofactor biosynthesis protein NifN [Agarivorans sp. 1_MG-2023]|uniref:nitrogenase iron-molybdenum cofactor biosynthesis protein NifN n=1 Tax=Agarivorans sp. 1_MG-2023 TaxID=3062634 RepID=UPI0026E18280|nr:nitrogenase iron-molybdenum cofactor biosynthesis protein NifN [Agarivorans sp. 1_MG-2023]MDO6762229.1 nitrogenase iron-molybdenum cofactor biosynthesis protein NifN [Agarivorans sp. 1_MG-2023]